MHTQISADGQLFQLEQTLDEFTRGFERPVPAINAKLLGQCDPEQCTSYGHADWYGEGINSKQDVFDLLSKGWAEGARKIQALRSEIIADVPEAKSRRRKPYWIDDGADLDPDRAIAGQWDTAYRHTRREITTGTSDLTLVINWGGNCGRTPEELFWSGAAMLVLADLLENAGYNVTIDVAIIAAFCNVDKVKFSCLRTSVKLAGEPLRIDTLASVLSHAGVFRTLGFRNILETPWYVGINLGKQASWNDLHTKTRTSPNLEDVLVDAAFDKDQALNTITQTLETITKRGHND